jgi:HEAT repeat protein
VRRRAADEIGEMTGRSREAALSQFDALVRFLDAERGDTKTQAAVVHALAKMGDQRALDALTTVLSSPDLGAEVKIGAMNIPEQVRQHDKKAYARFENQAASERLQHIGVRILSRGRDRR